MYKSKKILGIIPARGGSKGIPRKNIKELYGKPLIAYTIEASKKSKFLTRCVVSTDDKEIADIARSFGGEVPFMRPKEIARDSSSSMSVNKHTIKWLRENEGEEYDYIMLLPPTAPLRLSEDIDGCIKLIVDTNADSVMSMVKITDFSPKKIKKIKGDKILSFFEGQDENRESQSRQSQEPAYKRNCSIYLTKKNLIEKGDMFGNDSRAYIVPQDRFVDINEPHDFLLAEFLMKKMKNDL